MFEDNVLVIPVKMVAGSSDVEVEDIKPCV
jgi:hypothetical protein